ncbi:fibronectin type III domain-containing protein [Streptomyces sp. SID13666]|uniref:fibronectin type III domain-containing protein n=1 Tax=unclassified Streptomyces TaxID=2593676 RepID=UPI0013C1FD8B|nr:MULTISPECIES: fibronectin type III domain-containing protein [unclassified Streptomyces]NEA57341.1 fibronectin type III domain-containing protein [Streptomyces sp. SID13666]NEA73395.1 fibronectin type III domain-containing protein [Streptomyces sp. SID13588]
MPAPLRPVRRRAAAVCASLAAVAAFATTGISPAAGAPAAASRDVYVSPAGDDHAAGTTKHPVRTLEHARDLARARAGHLTADLTVHLAPGTYRQSKPLVLDARDSGSNGHRVIWDGAGSAVISGGRQVTGWHQVAGRPGLWSAPAPSGLTNTRQLYVDGVRAQRARGQVPVGLTATATGYTASAGTLAGWRNIGDAEFVYTSGESLWNIDRDGLGQWTEPRCPLASATGTTITMAQPCWDNSNRRVEFPDIPGRTVSMVGPGKLTNSGHASYIENAYELLDQPGEWYFDRKAHTVYYLPRPGEDPRHADVEAPVAQKLIDGGGTAAAPLRDVSFRGLQFSYATWLTPSGPGGFSEIQAGYTITGPTGWATQGLCHFVEGGTCPFADWTKMPGNVSLAYSRGVEFSGDVFAHLGAAGLELGTGTQDARVSGSIFTDISGNGLEIGGVDGAEPATGVQVTDNHLYALPREFHGGVAILNGYTQHTTIAHNQIDHVGYSAISLGWGGWPDKIGSPATPNAGHDNAVRDNLIFDYMQMLDDGGGIYTQGLTGTSIADGEKVTGNVIHGQWGLGKSVYTDNGCTYETVQGNVLYGASYANVASRHTDFRDALGNNDPTLVKDNWWEEGTGDGDNKGLVTTGNRIIAAPSDAPAAIVANAGLEPAYRGLLNRRIGALSTPEAPSRVGTSSGGTTALVVTFNPTFADGGAPVTSYTAHVYDAAGHEAATVPVTAAEFRTRGYLRVTGLRPGEPYTVAVSAANSRGSGAASLPSNPLVPAAVTTLSAAPTGAKLRAQAHAATVVWTPPVNTGAAEVTGYLITVSDGRTIEVAGRDTLVTQPSGKGMFRVIGGLTPGTAYQVTIAAVTAAGTGPSVTANGTTPAA